MTKKPHNKALTEKLNLMIKHYYPAIELREVIEEYDSATNLVVER